MTDCAESAPLAFGGAGGAGVSAVKYEPVVGVGYDAGGEVACELFFDCEWCGALLADEAYAMADAEDVGVNGHFCFAEYDGLYDVGGLASYTGETFELFAGGGDLALVFGYETLCHAYEVACLVVGVGYAAYVLVDNFGCGVRHGLGCGVVSEECGGDEVDALVCTLG